MFKLIEILRIGICPIGSLIMQESGRVPGTRVEWSGLERIGWEGKGVDWKGMDWKELNFDN